MPTAGLPLKQRRSGRVILFSPADEVLLISFVVSRSDGAFAFWATPGGEVEENESDRAAALREVREELKLSVDLEGPVHASTAEFEHNGAMLVSTDVFFAARCERDSPSLQAFTEEERTAMRSARWWTLEEIKTTSERVFPEDLWVIVERIMRK